MSQLSLNSIIKLADSYVNADLNSQEGFRKHLIAWYCFKFNTTFKDPLLLEHTFEELALLYFLHAVNERPESFAKILGNKEADDYEEWLKKQMGPDYVSEEDMIKQMVDYANEEEQLAKKLPDKITTNFSDLSSLGVDNE